MEEAKCTEKVTRTRGKCTGEEDGGEGEGKNEVEREDSLLAAARNDYIQDLLSFIDGVSERTKV